MKKDANAEVLTREGGLDTIIRDFIQSDFQKIGLEFYPYEVAHFKEKYPELNILTDGEHPQDELSIFTVIKK